MSTSSRLSRSGHLPFVCNLLGRATVSNFGGWSLAVGGRFCAGPNRTESLTMQFFNHIQVGGVLNIFKERCYNLL